VSVICQEEKVNEEEAKENMDAFKELIERMPQLEVATLEDLKTISIFSKTAATYGRHLVEAARKSPAMFARLGAQSDKWLADSQRAMEVHIFTEAERGRRAKEEEQVRATEPLPRGRGSVPSGEPKKWQRLGFDSEADMRAAEFLDTHRDVARTVIAEAKDEGDVPSKGAIKQKVATWKAERRAKEAEAEAAALKAKGQEKEVKEHPKVVKEYLDAARSYRDTLRLAVASRLRGMFSPESAGFVKRLHDEIRKLMQSMEE